MQQENGTIILNEAVVVDAASFLFWMMAEEVGVDAALSKVMASNGGCLIELPYAVDIISQYEGFNNLDGTMKAALGQAIANKIYETTAQGALLNGVVLAEDAANGRNTNASQADFGHLNMPPGTIALDGDFETMGSLCLRHPLPAVVFAHEPPKSKSGVIKIDDTSKALGFDIPMFMSNIQCVQVEEGLYMVMGNFHIPAENEASARMWHHAIPNSNKFQSQVNFVGEDGFHGSVCVSWHPELVH